MTTPLAFQVRGRSLTVAALITTEILDAMLE